MTDPTGSTMPENAPQLADPQTPAAAAPVVTADPAPLHDDPAIAKALEGLTPEQRETLLTTGGRNALAARGQEAKDAKAAATKAADKAADLARAELAQTVGKALGLIKDDEKTDPAKLAEQLTTVSSEARQAKLELAVFRAAPEAKADALALLDSRTAMAKLANVDPSDPAAVLAAITSVVADIPSLAQADPRRIPNPNPAMGAGGFGGAPTLDDQFAAAVKSGDVKEQIRIQNQKLAALAR